ncbi:GtrA family protein [Microbacterium sp. NC79]|uniref:GtrA family protein n=1 Tax=Microbacterium sp. NC79 TaxID=2851009 RepID=UPI001C2C25F2|nr:GtrA family protein [Microbacterium sp. NC79]
MDDRAPQKSPNPLQRMWAIGVIRYLAVGGFCFLFDVALLWFATSVLAIHLVPATAIAFLASFVVTYSMQRFVAFAADNKVAPSVVRYTVLVAANTIITTAIVWGIDEIGWGWLIGKILAVGVTTITNYFVYRYWVFAPQKIEGTRHV